MNFVEVVRVQQWQCSGLTIVLYGIKGTGRPRKFTRNSVSLSEMESLKNCENQKTKSSLIFYNYLSYAAFVHN